MADFFKFLDTSNKDDESVLDRIFTGDKTWGKNVNFESEKKVHGMGTQTQKTKAVPTELFISQIVLNN